MITSAIMTVSLGSVPLVCNTIDANGVVAPYSISMSEDAKAPFVFKKIGSDESEPIGVSDVDVSEPAKPKFSVVLDGRSLAFRVWGGFHRPLSQIDAVDLDGETKGLVFLSGICSQGPEFKPVVHEFVAPRYPTVDGKKVQNCFGATVDGRIFTFRNSRTKNGNSDVFLSWGENEDEVQRFEVTLQPFPPVPQKGNIYRSWGHFVPPNGENSPSFIEELSVNEETLRAAVTVSFQSFEEVAGPLMVARAHCGQFSVEWSG